MNKTPIEWTDYSANPLKFRDEAGKTVWGCVHASPGCVHCYAETLAHRYGRGGPFNVQTMAKLTPFLDEQELRRMLTYKPAAGKRCFVGDMTDVFGEWVERWMIAQLLGTMALRYDVTWQVLTKRADRLRDLMTDPTFRAEIAEWVEMLAVGDDGCDPLVRTTDDLRANTPDVEGDDWPLPNVWLGVSAEDQPSANERLPQLRDTPADVRFVSAEPLLAPIDLLEACYSDLPLDARMNTHANDLRVFRWVIVGGESGPKARKCSIEWVRHIQAQCRNARVSCFVKQLGSDSRSALGFGPIDGVHGKGNHIEEWPADIRVREFPA